MAVICRSAVVTVVPNKKIGVIDMSVDSCIDNSVVRQPFSIFLKCSRPSVAKSCSKRLSSPGSVSRLTLNLKHQTVAAFSANGSGSPHRNIQKSDGLRGAETVKREEELNDTRFDEAGRQIDQGVHHVEAGKSFEALALFMKVKELVSPF